MRKRWQTSQAGGQDHKKAERPTGEAGHWPGHARSGAPGAECVRFETTARRLSTGAAQEMSKRTCGRC